MRVEAINALRLLDEPAGEAMEEAIRLAAQVCGVPRAFLTVTDDRWQYMFTPFADALPPVPREIALCRFVVGSGTEVVLPDLREDPRFAGNPYVDGREASVRFYASVPLTTREGTVVGTLCAVHDHVHHISPVQVKMLRALADQMMALVELRRTVREAADAARTVAEQAAQVAEVLETSSDAYLAWHADGTIFGWNRAAEDLYGWTAPEAIGHDLGTLIVIESDQDAFRVNLASGRESPRALRVSHLTRNRGQRMVDLVIWPSRSSDGWHAFARDVTDLVRAEEERAAADLARRQAESLLTIAFEHAPNGTAILGVRDHERRRLLRVNPALVTLTRRDDLPFSDLAALLGTDADDVLADFDRLADGEADSFERVCRLRSGGGHIIVQLFLALARDAEGRPEHAVAQIRDITQQRAHELWLTRHATTDPLTGLPNRLAMRERLTQEIDALRAGEGALAVMMVDLDAFKNLNDTLGHQAGDDLLCNVAEALVRVLPADALASRLGGDEFVLVVPRHDRDRAERLAERITAAIDDVGLEFTGGLTRRVTASLGLTTTVDPATAPEELVQEADRHMYEVKRQHKAAL